MKTLREFAEMILNQVSENMGYRGEIVEIPNNNVENRVGLALSEPGNKLSPIVMIPGFHFWIWQSPSVCHSNPIRISAYSQK